MNSFRNYFIDCIPVKKHVLSVLTSLLNLLLSIKGILHDLVVQTTHIIISLVTVHNPVLRLHLHESSFFANSVNGGILLVKNDVKKLA